VSHELRNVTPGSRSFQLAFCKTGTHALVSITAYGRNRELAARLLKRLGISAEAYDPLIGFSWGGVTSLIIVYPNLDRAGQSYGSRLVRLNIGLEEYSDVIADLAQALKSLDTSA
jgi:cystathionine beta-lyase/cystathionine gamma-synthase